MLSRVFRGGVYTLAVPNRSKNRRAPPQAKARSATWSFQHRRAETYVDGVLHTTTTLKPDVEHAPNAMASVWGAFDIGGCKVPCKVLSIWWELVDHRAGVAKGPAAPVIRQAWLKASGGKAQLSFGCALVV